MLLFKAPLKHLRLILSRFLWKYITLPTWTHLHKQLFIDDLRVIFHLLLSSSTSDLSCQLYFQNASRIPRLLITTIMAVLVQTTISSTCTTYWLGLLRWNPDHIPIRPLVKTFQWLPRLKGTKTSGGFIVAPSPTPFLTSSPKICPHFRASVLTALPGMLFSQVSKQPTP